jgi:hypothetical protein
MSEPRQRWLRIWARRGWMTWLDYWLAGWWGIRSWFSRRPPARWSEGARDPVVLLPGVYERWSYLLRIGGRLNADGHPVHTVPRLGRNVAPIPHAAAVVRARLEELDLRNVVLVAHSKGGLIGKHVLAFDDPDGRVRSLVAIATPFAGSVMADYMVVPALRAFRRTDPVIVALAGQTGPDRKITAIAAEFDAHIPAGATLAGGENLFVPVIGHFRVLQHPVVIDAVVQAVDREPGTE